MASEVRVKCLTGNGFLGQAPVVSLNIEMAKIYEDRGGGWIRHIGDVPGSRIWVYEDTMDEKFYKLAARLRETPPEPFSGLRLDKRRSVLSEMRDGSRECYIECRKDNLTGRITIDGLHIINNGRASERFYETLPQKMCALGYGI